MKDARWGLGLAAARPVTLDPGGPMGRNDRFEPLDDGFVAFHDEKGERWKHKDMSEARTGEGYRLFVSDRGEERRYAFGPRESHDATILDLRDQLAKATSGPAAATTG
jgi:hypothetical protein